MAISHSGLVAQLGKVFGGLNSVNTFRGTTLPAREASIRTTYSTDPYDLLNDLTAGMTDAKSALDSYVSYSSDLVSQTIIEVVNADRVTPFTDLDSCLREWQRQLVNDAQTFNDCPVTASNAAVGSPTADYTFVVTTKDGDGKVSDLCVPDRYLITIANDADRGGTRWAETLSVVGKEADGKVTDASYPTGVGYNAPATVVDPDTDGGVVTDGSFDVYTSSNFTNWARGAGNTSSNINQVVGDYRNGSDGFALNLVSTGVAVANVTQAVTLAAETTYVVYFVVKVINMALTTAKVHVSLRRTDTGAVVADAAGTNCTVSSATLTSIGVGNWAKVSAVFCSPRYIPAAGLYLDVRLADGTTVTTAATVATAVYVDHVSFQAVDALYTGGPRIVAFSGIVQPLVTDQWQTTVSLASGAIGDYIIRWLDRTIGLADRDYKLPTVAGGTETLPDSNIV